MKLTSPAALSQYIPKCLFLCSNEMEYNQNVIEPTLSLSLEKYCTKIALFFPLKTKINFQRLFILLVAINQFFSKIINERSSVFDEFYFIFQSL